MSTRNIQRESHLEEALHAHLQLIALLLRLSAVRRPAQAHVTSLAGATRTAAPRPYRLVLCSVRLLAANGHSFRRPTPFQTHNAPCSGFCAQKNELTLPLDHHTCAECSVSRITQVSNTVIASSLTSSASLPSPCPSVPSSLPSVPQPQPVQAQAPPLPCRATLGAPRHS